MRVGELTVKDAAHCLCAVIHDMENLQPDRQIVIEISGLTRNDEKLGDYKVQIQRIK